MVLNGLPKAVLFDVDGTLYRQAPVRVRMCLEMILFGLSTYSPSRSFDLVRKITRFRQSRELLRRLGKPATPLDDLQYSEPAKTLGQEPAELKSVVSDWILRRPLRHIAKARRSGVLEFLRRLEENEIRAGVFSDYPVRDKLRALQIDQHFSVRLCATDPQINAFKPHPAGFIRACEIWQLQPSEVLYVGDRPEVDALGATAAGMPSLIITPKQLAPGCHTVPSFVELCHEFV